MKNLDWLFEVAPPFREAVCQAAADWLGSTSLNFAGAWLMEQHKYEHHDSDYEDLRGQHIDEPCVVPDRFCSGVAKLQISQFVAQETGKTAESDAAKSEIRDFDDTREQLEADVRQILHCAYMLAWMHGHENRRGSSFEKLHVEFYNLLDRQAAITERDVRTYLNREDSALIQRKIDGLQSRLETARETAEKYRAGSVAAQEEAEAWRAKCGKLLDAAHEMVRIGGDA